MDEPKLYFVREMELVQVNMKIRNACAWFYARFLAEGLESDRLGLANSLVIPHKYPLMTPPGPYEQEMLKRKSVQKKMLLKAQIQDIIEEYANQFRPDEDCAPQKVLERINAYIDQFVNTAAEQMTQSLPSAFQRNEPMEEVSKGMIMVFEKAEQEFQKRLSDQYMKITWYIHLKTYEMNEKFVLVPEGGENTCDDCQFRPLDAYTLKEIVELDLLPPLHPNCRCVLVWAPQLWSLMLTGDPEKGLSVDEKMKEKARTYEKPNTFQYNLTHWSDEVGDMLDTYVALQKKRRESGEWLDYFTSGLVTRYNYMKARIHSNSPLRVLLNMGMYNLAEMIVGAFAPERPGSFQHLMDILGTVGLIGGVVGGAKALAAGAVGSAGGGAASAGMRGISRVTRLLDNVDDAVGKRLHGLGDVDPQMRLKGKAIILDDIVEGGNKRVNGSIPNAENAVINPNKLTNYALNPEHPIGKNKAKVFESALGYNQLNVDDLLRQVRDNLPSSKAVLGKLDHYGQRYTVDMLITGSNGKTVTVRTGWIVRPNSNIPELTTIFVKTD